MSYPVGNEQILAYKTLSAPSFRRDLFTGPFQPTGPHVRGISAYHEETLNDLLMPSVPLEFDYHYRIHDLQEPRMCAITRM